MSNQLFLNLAIEELERQSRNQLYVTDPEAWMYDIMGLKLWSKQAEIVNSVVENKKTAIKSSHSTGKSFTMSALACWWTVTRAEMDAIVVSTAPTYEQVNKILWEAIRKNHRANNLIGTVNQQDEWKLDNGTVVGFGRKPADTSLHGFHGIHRPGGVLVLLDEGCGLHQNIFTATEAITTGAFDRLCTVGNPDEANTEFGRIFIKDDPSWNKITISAFDTPAWTGEQADQIVLDSLIQKDWVEDKRVSWGVDSPRWKSKILGEFSLDNSNTIFTLGNINTGKATEIDSNADTPLVFGVDVARMGEDESVIYSNRGGHVRLLDKWANCTLMETASRIHNLAVEHGATEVRVDGVGIGAGVFDRLGQLCDNQYSVVSLVGNASSPDLDRWRNIRAHWWDTVRERMSKGEIDLDYSDEALQDELLSVNYHFKNQRNALQIESKEELRSRIGKSPDFADAFIYSLVDIGFDPKEPVNQLTMGEEFELTLEQMLYDMDMQVSPL